MPKRLMSGMRLLQAPDMQSIPPSFGAHRSPSRCLSRQHPRPIPMRAAGKQYCVAASQPTLSYAQPSAQAAQWPSHGLIPPKENIMPKRGKSGMRLLQTPDTQSTPPSFGAHHAPACCLSRQHPRPIPVRLAGKQYCVAASQPTLLYAQSSAQISALFC